MRFKYSTWTKKLLSTQSELDKIDQMTVHNLDGKVVVYTAKDLQLSLIEKIRQSHFLFVVVNYVGGYNTILCPEFISYDEI
ncbi:hypothetical protein [Carboxylicivirga caseinilyticus]|uniref:hypothetical protein n=1 Tax=Carboxylicivirga caseinilyticus TaxID=3417572 RepID=UPI003D356A0F|nr:hypothetical protein [Marinilabiliaceae bacterium A049]